MHKSTPYALALFTSIFAGTASAETLKMAHVFPAVNMNWTHGGEVFAKTLAELTGEKISVQSFPAGQLGKETSNLIASGMVEMGLIIPSYEVEKLPLSTVGELPGFNEDSCTASARMWDLVKDGGALYEAELKPMGLRALYAISLNPYQLVTSRKPVDSLEAATGLKIRANGAAMNKAVRAIGATPLQVSFSEFYDALGRGTIDGGVWPLAWTRTNGLEGAINYATEGVGLGTAVTIAVISERAWQKLTPEDQAHMLKAGEIAQAHFCAHLNALEIREVEALETEGIINSVKLSPIEVQRWNDILLTVQEDWAQSLISTKRPGAEVLKAYREAQTTR